MGFPTTLAEQVLVDCSRHCAVCHKFCGTKMELHHIEQRADGGEDSYDNCIPLCFDCHADVKSYNPRHPKGRKYSSADFKSHRDRWYEKVKNSSWLRTDSAYVELDRKMFREIIEVLRSSILDHACKNDYGSSFYQEWHDGLYRFLETAESPESEFFDADMEGGRAGLSTAMRRFLESLSQHTFLIKSDDGGRLYRVNSVEDPDVLGYLRNKAKDEVEWEELIRQRRMKDTEVRETLNALAEQLCDTYKEFIRFGRNRLLL